MKPYPAPTILVPAAALVIMGATGDNDVMSSLLLALVILLPVAKLVDWTVEKVRQPAVLGELVAGILLGNLNLLGINGLEYLETDRGLEILAGLGVILLLFELGLDSSLADLLKVGLSSFVVA